MDCSFITLREPYNNKRRRCDIAWLRATNDLYQGFFELNGKTISRFGKPWIKYYLWYMIFIYRSCNSNENVNI